MYRTCQTKECHFVHKRPILLRIKIRSPDRNLSLCYFGFLVISYIVEDFSLVVVIVLQGLHGRNWKYFSK
ncbi:hypothetical protein L2E82_46080 [Cichorium intybus]|uniref:Uncharacterized protein n=1 Tax=Cichorium intybus TaxID=13427 RepID=A0ACB8YSQ3_CICIN|nr:hypothetical protein L2E82_46080 [Cichorium intybus]